MPEAWHEGTDVYLTEVGVWMPKLPALGVEGEVGGMGLFWNEAGALRGAAGAQEALPSRQGSPPTG